MAVLFIAISNIRYMWSIYNDKSRPSLAASLVFIASLGSVLCSSIMLDVSKAVIYTLSINVALNAIILLFILCSSKSHKVFTKLESGSLIVVCVSLWLWYMFDNAWFGLLVPTAVDTLGMILVIRKLDRDPGSEDIITWSFAAIAYIFTFLSLDSFSFKDLLFTVLNILFCSWIALKSYRKG